MDDIRSNYYAIIPANIRYNKDLPANAKLLYGEITALCNVKGYCWASNTYFAELYNVTENSISKWIRKLEDNGYIRRVMIYHDNSQEIKERRIYIENGITQDIIAQNVTNEDYEEIFEYWNGKNIIRHKQLTGDMKDAMRNALKQYDIDTILDSIDHYAQLLKDPNFYYEHKFNLVTYLKQKNGMPRFLDEGDIWNSYHAPTLKGSYHSKGEEKCIPKTKRRTE